MGVWIFVAAILTVIMIHEAGHFFVAKAFDFKATKFFIGFGPTIWSTQRGETEYGVKALPLGGFVKIVGMNPYEDIPEEDRPRSYANKPRWQRALVIVAGSATHFVVAFVIFLVTVMTIGFPTDQPTNELGVIQASIEGETSPAVAAGLEPGDRIVAVDGRPTTEWTAIRSYIREEGGSTARFTIERDGARREVTVELGQGLFDSDGRLLAYAPFGEELPEAAPGQEVAGFLGVSPEPRYETKGLGGAVVDAGARTWDATVLSVRGMGEMGRMVFGGGLLRALQGRGEREIDEGPIGIIGAGRYASESVQSGAILNLIGLIIGFTVFVGLMNLLPLPPLDGGHLAVLAWEGITRKAVDVRKLIPVAATVIAFFVVLFVAVLYLDLARPIRIPF
jgi:membrane-associated protease RseP (regulator of RpoE activity)